MKAVFMGSDPIALPMLDLLGKERPGGIELTAVFTQPDRKTGRGMRLRPNAIKRWAMEQGLPVRQPLKCGMEDADYLAANGIERVIVMAYGQILPKVVLEAVPAGIVNLHASILPRLRGASPIHTAVALGLGESGVSLMRIIPRMDAGPVAAVERVPIGESDTSGDLHGKLAAACVPLMRRCVPGLVNGDLDFRGQDESAATYCRIIEKTDAHLDFREPARVLANRIRAFQPWPGAAFPVKGIDVQVRAAEALEAPDAAAPGTVLEPDAGTLDISCGRGILRVHTLQRPGGKPLGAAAFLRGFPIEPGSTLESRPMRPLEAERPFPYRRKRNSSP